MTRILHVITDAATSRWGKFVTIGLWLVIAIVLTGVAPKLARLYDNNIGQSIPGDADSQVAQRLLLKEFPGTRGTPAIIVFNDPNGLGVDDRNRMKQVSDWLISGQNASFIGSVVSVFTVPQAARQLISQDGSTMTMIATLNGSASDQKTLNSVKYIRQYLSSVTAKSSLEANVTGPAGIVTDLTGVFSSVDVALLLSTIGLVFVLLIVLYRSPILALLPLLAVGIALQIVNALLGFAARAELFPVSQMSGQIATVLLFGAGTDYSIFIASRFREELQHTRDKHLAMQQTMRAVGEAITSSAATVILALLTLLLAALGLYTALGPTLAIAIVVMLLAGLTLVPALIVWLGRGAFWPFMPRYQPEVDVVEASSLVVLRGFWGSLGAWTVRHRVLAVVGSTVLLVVLVLGNIGSQPSFNLLAAVRVPTDSGRGFTELQQHFPAGTLAPTTVLIQLSGAEPDVYQHLAQLDAVSVALQNVADVISVMGPTRPDGKEASVDAAALQANIAALPTDIRDAIRAGKGLPTCNGSACPALTPQFLATVGSYAASLQDVSADNSTAQLSVILADDPYSLAAIERVPSLRAALTRALASNGLGANAGTHASFHIGGQTSLQADTLHYNQRDTLLIVPVVLLLVLLVLALLLRSLVAPLYLLVAVTLNFLAAIGVCSFFFQRIQGQDGFNYAIPLYTFIFLVALGADYTIFLMSRVREEVQKRGLEKGVPFAVSRTGGVITSAGLILAGTFLVLTTLPLTILYQLGVCVAVGILMDTFIVRGFLVPGLVLLLGRWNWWPGRLEAGHVESQESDESASASSTVASGQQ
jgi:putative drug exporter of the RND superfamily